MLILVLKDLENQVLVLVPMYPYLYWALVLVLMHTFTEDDLISSCTSSGIHDYVRVLVPREFQN